jgi:predicted nuclease with TOPRIM domain
MVIEGSWPKRKKTETKEKLLETIERLQEENDRLEYDVSSLEENYTRLQEIVTSLIDESKELGELAVKNCPDILERHKASDFLFKLPKLTSDIDECFTSRY